MVTILTKMFIISQKLSEIEKEILLIYVQNGLSMPQMKSCLCEKLNLMLPLAQISVRVKSSSNFCRDQPKNPLNHR